MADLNNLFSKDYSRNQTSRTNTQQQSSYQQNKYPFSKNLFGQKTQTTQPQNKSSSNLKYSTKLTYPLSRTQKQLAKTTVQNENMLEQIEFFRKGSNNQFYQKALILVAPLLLLGLLNILNKKICFEMIQFGVSLLLVESNFIENRTLKLFIQTLPLLTFSALFYDILTQYRYVGEYYVTLANLPALFISVTATVNFLFIKKTQFLSEEGIRNIEINLSYQQKIGYFFKKYFLRAKNMVNIARYIAILNLSLAMVFTLYCLFYSYVQLWQQTIVGTLNFILVYCLVDFYVYSIEFLSRQVSLFNLKHKMYQVHVCMSLLRLKSNSKNHEDNQKIQHRCLSEVAKELKHNPDYLQTPVRVNYSINNYRDIFEIYASNQLHSLLSKINQIAVLVSKNNKIAESNKTWKQDLFIQGRKKISQLENSFLLLKMLSEVQKRKVLFLILVRLATQSPLRMQILETVRAIIESLTKKINTIELFEIGQRKMRGWVYELQRLERGMKNESVGISSNKISKVDQNGWAHVQSRSSQKGYDI